MVLAALVGGPAVLAMSPEALPIPLDGTIEGSRFEHVNLHAHDRPGQVFRVPGAQVGSVVPGRPVGEDPPVRRVTGTLPRLRVEGTRFVDPAGREVFLRGVNYSHRTKWKPYWSWQTANHMAEIRGWGFNCVRYLVSWDALEPTPGTYDEAYLDHIAQVLDWAHEEGVYVLVDMHQDLFSGVFGGDGFPAWAAVDDLVEPNVRRDPWFLTYFTREVLASFKRLWTEVALQDAYARAWAAVASRARGRSNVLGYDLMNEPFPGLAVPWWFESRRLTPFYRRIGARIRGVDPDAVLFYEPAAITANVGFVTATRPPPGPAVYAPHYYDALLEFGGNYGRRGWIARRALRVMRKESRQWSVPLFIGEMGVSRRAQGARQAMQDQCDAAERVLASGWTFWDYTPERGAHGPLPVDSMSLVAQGREHPAMDAYVRPYPRAVAGRTRAMRFDLGTRRFTLEVEDVPPGGVTEVFLPARHYPAPRVQAPGEWSFDEGTRILRVRFPEGAATRTLVVTPGS